MRLGDEAVRLVAEYRLGVLRAESQAVRLKSLIGLCASRQLLFEHRRVLLDLNDALDRGELALTLADSDETACLVEANLANAYRLRHEHTGSASDLRAGLAHAWDSLRCATTTKTRARRLSNFGVLLRLRFERYGERADIDEAIAVLTSAIDLIDDDGRPRVCANAAVAFRLRGASFRRIPDLTEAVALAQRSAELGGEHSIDYADFLLGEAWAQLELFFACGKVAFLDAAAAAAERARSHARSNSSDEAGILLARAVIARWIVERDLAADASDAAEAAVVAARDAIDSVSPDPADRPRHVVALARALRLRFRISGDPADAAAAVELRLRSSDDPAAPPFEAALSAYWVARWSMEDGDVGKALSAMMRVVDLLHEIVWLGLAREARERHLVEWAQVGPDAAAVALAAEAPGVAVELLEHGRNLMWQHAIGRPDEIDRVAQTSPELAERLDRVRRLVSGARPISREDGFLHEVATPPVPAREDEHLLP